MPRRLERILANGESLKMKLSKRQLKRIIREAMFDEFFRQKGKQNLLEIYSRIITTNLL